MAHTSEPGLRPILDLYRAHRLRLGLGLLVYIIKASPYWALPLVLADVVQVAAAAGPASDRALLRDAGLFGLLLLQNIPMNALYLRLTSGAVRQVEVDIRDAIATHVQRLSMSVFTRASSGQLQTKLLRDADVVEQTSRQLLQDVPAVLLTMLVALGVTAVRAPAAFVVLIPLIALSVWSARASSRAVSRDQQAHRRSLEATATAFAAMLRMVPVTRAHGGEERELSSLRDRLDQHMAAGRQLDSTVGWFGATTWVAMQASGAACLLMSGWAAAHHRYGIDIGDVVLLSGYFATLTGSLLGLLNQLPAIHRGLESVRSLLEVLQEQDVEQNDGKPALPLNRGHVRFETVSFRYDATLALDRLDLEIETGEILAVVGRSGAGKSTMLNLLLGFLRPTDGRVLVDGADLAGVDLRTYRRQVAVVPQEVLLTAGSLRANITHGLPDLPDKRLLEAVEAAGLRELLDDLPDGWDTSVGEQGLRLSGGQRQRVAIARAFVRDPRLVLLDEATSALDLVSEQLVQAGLQRLFACRTCIVVAHRLATIERADRILVLDRGRPVALGPHRELLLSSSHYRDLVSAVSPANTLASARVAP